LNIEASNMTDSIPVPVLACTLSAPAAAERAGRWDAFLHENLLRRSATPRGVRLELRPRPAVAAELDALVAAERECCAFLTMRVRRAGDRLVLEVDAPAEAREIVAAMFGAAGS
jgi:hypothetical protein